MNSFEQDFSESYAQSVERICQAGEAHGWDVASYSHLPNELHRTHLLRLGPSEAKRTLVVSSGLHGVEGFLGAAIQVRLIRNLSAEIIKSLDSSVLMIHAINPFGFETLRRVDEDNVDLNRNFLFGDEQYQGAHPQYRAMDRFLNPRQSPLRAIPFFLKAACLVASGKQQALTQAIAEGQYEFPLGLFFGGSKQTSAVRMLCEKLLSELRSAGEVLHLDLHTGLGKSGGSQMLTDTQLSESEREKLNLLFGNAISVTDSGAGYRARGSFSRWFCHHIRNSCSFCYEFGTVSPIKILQALRAENAAYHWGDLGTASHRAAKSRLKQAFCPQSEAWRKIVIQSSDQLLRRVVENWLVRK